MKRLFQALQFGLLTALTFGTLGAQEASAAVLTSPGSVTINGAIFELINPTNPTGTGVFQPFLRINSNQDPAEGFNTDARPTQFPDANDPFTKSLLLSNVPIVNIGGTDHRQFTLDLNEPSGGNQALIDLDELQIFLGNAPNLNNYPLGLGNLVYDLTEVLTLADLNAGSGRADLLASIPNSLFTGPNPYVYLYSRFLREDGGFEEWAVRSTNGTPIPTPALLPGLVGMGIAALRKKKQSGEEQEA